jgi:RNA 2',3'-cyclic 3'-phosphodiesterase
MRLFVAVTPAEEIQEKLRRMMEELKPLARGPRWVRGEGLHLTLKFLGDVKDNLLGAIVDGLKEVRLARGIELRFRGVGSFPKHQHPRVIWAGVAAGEELAALVSSIEARMEGLGFAREQREFAPHVTLARIKSREPLENLMGAAAAFASYDFGAMVVREFHLFQSTLKPSGAEYSKIATFPFARGDSGMVAGAAEDPQ